MDGLPNNIPADSSLLDSLVVMRRRHLDALPAVRMPEGYDLRVFRLQDEGAWEQVIGEAFERDDRNGFFDRRMRQDKDFFDPSRILMVWKGDVPVATASAWYRNAFGPEVGYLHKVAVVESERGRGLGYQVSLACLHKMAADGRTSAALRTQVKRIPAINAYLKLGFEPWILEDEQHRNWTEVRRLIESGAVL